jgi:hypothetical protein
MFSSNSYETELVKSGLARLARNKNRIRHLALTALEYDLGPRRKRAIQTSPLSIG